MTSLVCPPDTEPVLDEPGLVEMLKFRTRNLDLAHVFPLGALTRGLAGEALTEMAELTEAGCVGLGQGDAVLRDTLVLHRALQYAATFGFTTWLRPNDAWLGGGVAAKGPLATRMGLTGVPVLAETIALATIFELVRDTGARVHLCRLSSAAGVELVRRAKAEGLPVSCDASIHQLHLIDVDIGYFDAAMRLVPPLRQQRDRDAIRAGLADGTIDALVSDHTPITEDEKHLPFAEASPGRDRARAAARPGAQVGRRRRPRPGADARGGDQPAVRRARPLQPPGCGPAARPGRGRAGRRLRLRPGGVVAARPVPAPQPQPAHALRGQRAARAGALDAGRRPGRARRGRRPWLALA